MENKEKAELKEPKIEADKILDQMVALTLSRHANFSDEEFAKAMNLAEMYSENEDGAVREARFKLYIAITREMLSQINAVKRLNAILKDLLGVTDEMIKEQE